MRIIWEFLSTFSLPRPHPRTIQSESLGVELSRWPSRQLRNTPSESFPTESRWTGWERTASWSAQCYWACGFQEFLRELCPLALAGAALSRCYPKVVLSLLPPPPPPYLHVSPPLAPALFSWFQVKAAKCNLLQLPPVRRKSCLLTLRACWKPSKGPGARQTSLTAAPQGWIPLLPRCLPQVFSCVSCRGDTVLKFILYFFNGNIVDFQCSVNFCSVTQLYVCVYSFPLWFYHRILNTLLCAFTVRTLLSIHLYEIACIF